MLSISCTGYFGHSGRPTSIASPAPGDAGASLRVGERYDRSRDTGRIRRECRVRDRRSLLRARCDVGRSRSFRAHQSRCTAAPREQRRLSPHQTARSAQLPQLPEFASSDVILMLSVQGSTGRRSICIRCEHVVWFRPYEKTRSGDVLRSRMSEHLDVVTRAVLGFGHHGINDWRRAATLQRGRVRSEAGAFSFTADPTTITI